MPCFWIFVWIFSDPREGYLGVITSCRCYWVMCSCLCFWFCGWIFRLLATQGNATRGQLPLTAHRCYWVICSCLCFWFCGWIFSDPRKGYLGAIASCWCNCNMIPALRRRLIFVIIFSTIYLYRPQRAWHSYNEPGMIVMKNRSLVIGCNLKIGHCHLDHFLKRKAKKSLTIYRLKRNSLIGNKTEGSDALRGLSPFSIQGFVLGPGIDTCGKFVPGDV